MTNHPQNTPTDDEFRKAAKVLAAAQVSEDILDATPDKSGDWLDELLEKLSYDSCCEGYVLSDYNDVGYCYEPVQEAKTAILAHIQAEVLAARVREQQLVSALGWMYVQYCSGTHGHDFMGAGETASEILESYGLMANEFHIDQSKLDEFDQRLATLKATNEEVGE